MVLRDSPQGPQEKKKTENFSLNISNVQNQNVCILNGFDFTKFMIDLLTCSSDFNILQLIIIYTV